MRKTLSSVIFVALLFIIFPMRAYSKNITVEISKLKENKGQVLIGLYNNADNFPLVNKAYKGIVIKVETKEIHYTFSDIPAGNYAIAVIHDLNNNSELDKNLFGIPTEGYGFSNNPATRFGMPSFDEVKFHFDDSSTAKIKINY
jgi:uncharacterized protein (DUF2141 family)